MKTGVFGVTLRAAPVMRGYQARQQCRDALLRQVLVPGALGHQSHHRRQQRRLGDAGGRRLTVGQAPLFGTGKVGIGRLVENDMRH